MKEKLRPLLPFAGMLTTHWRPLLAGVLFGLIAAASTVGLLSLSGWFLSATAFAGLSPAAAKAFNYFLPSVGIRTFAISRTLARYVERLLSHDATFRLLGSLRVWFFRKIEPLAPARLMRYRSGDVLNRIVSDIDALDNLALRIIAPSVVAFCLALLLAVFLWNFSPLMASVSLAALLTAGFVVPAAAMFTAAETGRRLAIESARLRVHIVEGLQGLSELLVFGGDHAHLEALMAQHDRLEALQRKMSRIRGASGAAVTLLAGAALLMVLFHGARLVNSGALHGTHLALTLLAVLAAFDAVVPLPAAYQYLGQTLEAARRLLGVVDTRPAVAFPSASTAKPRDAGVTFEKVDFRYDPDGPSVLEAIDLSVAPGRCLAVLGQTGAGKSTLAHLLVRFWDPTAGRIHIGGVDIRELGEADLRKSVSLLSQHSHLFDGTIRTNLSMARPGAGDGDLWDALAAVRLADFVRQLPEGLETWIGEGGKRVSGGQARRLALARIYLRDAPVWVMDEPTEGLDRINEQAILDNIFHLARGKTVLLITHRMTALERTDSIVVLENGYIVEQGPHDWLLRSGTRYASLRAQIQL